MKSFIAALRNLVLPFGQTSGRRIILNGDQGRIELYDTAGNLVYVIDSALPGASAGMAGARQVNIVTTGTDAKIFMPANGSQSASSSQISAALFNNGTGSEHVSMQFLGPGMSAPADDRLEMLLNSQNADGSSAANLLLRLAGGSSGSLLTYDKSAGFKFFRHGIVAPTSTTAPAFVVNAPAGMTDNIQSWQVNGSTKVDLDENGVFTRYADNGWNNYVPAVGNTGGATWTTQAGFWQRMGKRIDVCVYLKVNAAGSGAGIVTVDMPTSVDRSTRQTIHMSTESLGPGGSHVGTGHCLFFIGGSGATADRLRISDNGATNADANITGADLLTGGLITIQGWYREA